MLVEKHEWRLWSDNTINFLCHTKLVALKLRKKLNKQVRYVVWLRSGWPHTMDTDIIGAKALKGRSVDDPQGQAAADALCAELCKRLGTRNREQTSEERRQRCLEAFYEIAYGPPDEGTASIIQNLKLPNDRLRPHTVSSDADKLKVENECLRRGHMAFFDPDPENGIGWILQILFEPRTNQRWVVEGYVAPRGYDDLRPEDAIQKNCENTLQKYDIEIRPHNERDCDVGEADIVTPNSVYEIKVIPSRTEFFQAVGQVLLYKVCLKKANAFIVCQAAGPASLPLWIDSLRGYLQRLGVNDVFLWPGEKGRFDVHARHAS